MKQLLQLALLMILASPAAAQQPYEVDEFRPDAPAKGQVINLAPSAGASAFGFYGYTWIHLLDADNTTVPNFGAAHIGINSTDVVIGSIGFGSQAPKPITFRLGSTVLARLQSNEFQVQAGRIVVSRSSTGVILDLVRAGVSKGRIIVDTNGARLEGFADIDDIKERLTALENR